MRQGQNKTEEQAPLLQTAVPVQDQNNNTNPPAYAEVVTSMGTGPADVEQSRSWMRDLLDSGLLAHGATGAVKDLNTIKAKASPSTTELTALIALIELSLFGQAQENRSLPSSTDKEFGLEEEARVAQQERNNQTFAFLWLYLAYFKNYSQEHLTTHFQGSPIFSKILNVMEGLRNNALATLPPLETITEGAEQEEGENATLNLIRENLQVNRNDLKQSFQPADLSQDSFSNILNVAKEVLRPDGQLPYSSDIRPVKAFDFYGGEAGKQERNSDLCTQRAALLFSALLLAGGITLLMTTHGLNGGFAMAFFGSYLTGVLSITAEAKRIDNNRLDQAIADDFSVTPPFNGFCEISHYATQHPTAKTSEGGIFANTQAGTEKLIECNDLCSKETPFKAPDFMVEASTLLT